MMSDQLAIVSTSREQEQQEAEPDEDEQIRDIHALTPPRPPSANNNNNRNRAWETSSHRSSSLSVGSEGALSENFTSMSREFNALVLAGSTIGHNGSQMDNTTHSGNNQLGRIGEDDFPEETNPLAIVPDTNPLGPAESHPRHAASGVPANGHHRDVSSVQRVKKEEVESKITAWQTAKVAKVNNRFKREDAIISGWESEQVQKADSWMKKVEVRKKQSQSSNTNYCMEIKSLF